ncbi:MAG: thermosome subunit beta [Nitrososphaeria archaeon]
MAVGAPSAGGTQPIIILKEGAGRTRGREAQSSNIMVAKIISQILKTSLGPRGMDKMLVDSFGDVVITNDGATILKEMDIEHPIGKMMVEVAKAQDEEVGDGTTTVIVLAGELLSKAEELIEKEVHPTVIIDGYRKAALKSLEVLDEIAVSVDPKDRDVLTQVAKTSLASKLVSEEADTLAKMAVDAVLKVLEETDGKYAVDLDNIKVEKKEGQSIDDTRLIDGIVLDKEVVHPDMPKLMEKPKIALLDVSLEIEKTEFDAKINVESPEQMKAFLKQEEDTLKSMVDKIESSGANLVLCQKGIDDLVQHFLARKQIMAVRRIKKSDMDKLALATGGRSVSRIDDLSSKDLGTAKLVEERRVGEDKMVFVEGCKNPKSVTMLVRGGTQRIVDEAERSIHDALSVVRDVVVDGKLVAGGGAPEAELSLRLGDYATSLAGKEQLAVQLFAKAIETIPSQLAENAGMDPIETMVELMAKHKGGKKWAGINVYDGKIVDMYKLKVLEPVVVKKQAIKSSVEAASMILKIDDIIAAGKMGEGPGGKGVGEGGEEGEE